MKLHGAAILSIALIFVARASAQEVMSPASFGAARPIQTSIGVASWYGADFHGRATANGEIFDMGSLTAAHRTLPLPCYARVTNLRNGRSIVVRVNDRGPYVGGRMIDVSARVAKLLDFSQFGVAKVKLDYLGKAPPGGRDSQALLATLRTGAEPIVATPPRPTTLAAFTPPPGPAGETIVERVIERARAPAVSSPFGELQPPHIAADVSTALMGARLRGALAYADEPVAPLSSPPSPFGDLVVQPFLSAAR